MKRSFQRKMIQTRSSVSNANHQAWSYLVDREEQTANCLKVASCCGYNVAKSLYSACMEIYQICSTVGLILMFCFLQLKSSLQSMLQTFFGGNQDFRKIKKTLNVCSVACIFTKMQINAIFQQKLVLKWRLILKYIILVNSVKGKIKIIQNSSQKALLH